MEAKLGHDGKVISDLSDELFSALRNGHSVRPLRHRHPELTIEDAYAISLAILAARRREGERVVGKKIGVTSRAVQEMLNVDQPDFGFLTNRMHMTDGIVDLAAERLIAPRAEAEIAFVLRERLAGPGIDAAAVIAATDYIAPCFEIVDSRISDWDIGIVDTIADNASCGVFVLGDERLDPRQFDLPALRVTVSRNGAPLSQGFGHAVQGSPAQAVAWLANTLGGFGVTLDAGDIILSGSLVPLAPAFRGDRFAMTLEAEGETIGRCDVEFR